MDHVVAVAGVPALRRGAGREYDGVSVAATITALYVFFVVGRLQEVITPLASVRPILVLAVLAIALACLLPPVSVRAFLKPTEVRGVVALFLLAFMFIPMSVWPGGSLRFLVESYSKTVLFFFLLVYCVRSLREYRHLLLAFVGAAAMLCVAVCLSKIGARAQVTATYDPNDLAFVIVCMLPVTAALVFVSRGLLRLALCGVVALSLLTVTLTQSRGGFVTLAIAGPLTLLKARSRSAFLTTGLLVAALAFVVVLAPRGYWDRMGTIVGVGNASVDQYSAGGLSTARWEIWKAGLSIVLSNPVFGVGIGNFAIAEGATKLTGRWNAPHNAFLQLGAELGLVGLTFFVFLLYRGVRNCRAVVRLVRGDPRGAYHRQVAHGLEVSFYAYIIGGLALSQAYADLVYLLFAAALILRRLAARLVQTQGGPGPQRVVWWRTRS